MYRLFEFFAVHPLCVTLGVDLCSISLTSFCFCFCIRYYYLCYVNGVPTLFKLTFHKIFQLHTRRLFNQTYTLRSRTLSQNDRILNRFIGILPTGEVSVLQEYYSFVVLLFWTTYFPVLLVKALLFL